MKEPEKRAAYKAGSNQARAEQHSHRSMPRYYCDYCDTYLTHDSAPGRKQHMRGWKHRENVKLYYDPYVPE